MLEEIISRYNAIEYFVKAYQVDISREKAVLDSALRSFIEATKKWKTLPQPLKERYVRIIDGRSLRR